MKDALIIQRDIVSPESAAQQIDMADDFSARVCPHCGGYLSPHKEIIDKDSRKILSSDCSTCNWRKYASRVGESADRHGLV